jgi:spore coat protein U-like protein
MKVALVAVLASMAVHTDSFALTATGTMPLSVGIGTTCTVASSGFGFGSFANTTTAINQTVGAYVTCSNGLTYFVDMDPGLNPTASNGSRQFASGANRLTYNIYKDAAHTQVWGTAMSGGTQPYFTGTGTQQFQAGYLQIPAQTTPPTGIYNDTITITATF